MEGAELVMAACPLQIRHKDIGSRRDAFAERQIQDRGHATLDLERPE